VLLKPQPAALSSAPCRRGGQPRAGHAAQHAGQRLGEPWKHARHAVKARPACCCYVWQAQPKLHPQERCTHCLNCRFSASACVHTSHCRPLLLLTARRCTPAWPTASAHAPTLTHPQPPVASHRHHTFLSLLNTLRRCTPRWPTASACAATAASCPPSPSRPCPPASSSWPSRCSATAVLLAACCVLLAVGTAAGWPAGE